MAQSEARSAYGTRRVSRQRAAIADAAVALAGAFTIDDLARAVSGGAQAAGTATVYRAVAAMEASGWVERVGEREGHALYVHCTDGHRHHHHAVCEGCGTVRSTSCPLDRIAENSADLDGFVVTRHEVTLYGLCPSCAHERSGKA
jgi:Fur family transcriptional regulator, ferric uptake regulator